MSTAGFQRAKEIFLSACELPEEARESFLREACGAHSELLADVRAMLAADEDPLVQTGEHLRDGIDDAFREAEVKGELIDGVPSRVGRYRVVDVLGEGGMGTVYLAEQDQPRRRVALKVIRADLAASGSGAARLVREGEALGRLQHPGIAQVYDAGLARFEVLGELPFFAMEYVDGVNLLAFVQEKRADTRQRLLLFLAVCDAVHHAHQKGVIHRDLKPDNILVRDRSTGTGTTKVQSIGAPVVLDFGIARITDGDVAHTTLQTQVGELIGTLPYMSPEQLEGDPERLDTRSDVYALGVILFQLLSGRLPIETKGVPVAEVVRRVQQDEPTRLGSVDTAFRGDLETIVGRALAKEREDRYGSVAELGEDVRRHLQHEPIAARPPSALYQLGKFVRRHKGLAAGMAGTFLAVTAGFVVSTSLYFEARAANEAKTRETDRALAVQDFLLVDMIDAATPFGAGKDVRFGDLLDEASEQIDGRFSEHPETHATLLYVIGRTYAHLSSVPEGLELTRRALDLRREVLGPDHRETLQSQFELARMNSQVGDFEEALRHLAGFAERARTSLGEEDALTLRGMLLHCLMRVAVSSSDEETEGIIEEAEALHQLGIAATGLAEDDRYENSKILGLIYLTGRQGEKAVAFYDELLKRVPDRGDGYTAERVSIVVQRASSSLQLGHFEEAKGLLEKELAVATEKLGERHPITLQIAFEVGQAMVGMGDYVGGEHYVRGACEGYEASFGAEHAFAQAAKVQLAILLRRQERLDESLELVYELQELRLELYGADSLEMAETLDLIGAAHHSAGDVQSALENSSAAYEIYARLVGEDDAKTLDVLYNVAMFKGRLDRLEEAREDFLEMRAPLEKAYGPTHPYVIDAVQQAARMLVRGKRYEEALPELDEALSLWRQSGPERNYRMYDTMASKGYSLARLGRYEEAETVLLEAWDAYGRLNVPERRSEGRVDEALVEVYEATGRADEASRWTAQD